MKRRIALQLYSLRAEIARLGMSQVLEAVAKMGYQEVQPAGWGDLKPGEFKKVCDDNGLLYLTDHGLGAGLENLDKTIETAKAIGLQSLCLGYGPNDFKDMDAIRKAADNTNKALDRIEAAGLSAFQHNHYWEFALHEGQLKYDYYLALCPRVKLELDAFWSANFGANDPVDMARHYADRIVLLHMKDGRFPANPDDRIVDMRPLGEGQLDIPGICAQVPESVEQIIVELDQSNKDMMESVRISHDYLVKAGLGR